MNNEIRRIHSYYAEAHVVGGQLTSPVEPQAKLLLLHEGDGACSRQVAHVCIEDRISAKSGFTKVCGIKEAGIGWVTSASSKVNIFDAQDVVTADTIVGRISSTHPLEGYVPTISFEGTAFTNLRIKGYPVTAVFDFQICGEKPAEPAKKDPDAEPYLLEYLKSESFRKNVAAQDEVIANHSKAPKWLRDGYCSGREEETVRCSIVKEVRGLPDSIPSFGHVIVVPEFGKVFLGELVVGKHFDLTMIRIELDAVPGSCITVAGPGVNGKTKP
jgi:hypothetical protein